MAQIEAGQKLGEYVFDTAFEKDVKLSEKVKQADKTVLLFLRYYGCRICQLDMRFYADAYDRFKERMPSCWSFCRARFPPCRPRPSRAMSPTISSAIPR